MTRVSSQGQSSLQVRLRKRAQRLQPDRPNLDGRGTKRSRALGTGGCNCVGIPCADAVAAHRTDSQPRSTSDQDAPIHDVPPIAAPRMSPRSESPTALHACAYVFMIVLTVSPTKDATRTGSTPEAIRALTAPWRKPCHERRSVLSSYFTLAATTARRPRLTAHWPYTDESGARRDAEPKQIPSDGGTYMRGAGGQ
jgi:hypothetical protein